ncbi:acetyl-CoA carboxylase biotin carboxyl carrier protein [Sinorhizobium saheli]|jgi:acetyl-CoA carboxylase biotin carboxyl carrier protein|uniref:Biotin carboxyl carrier protein of acetyl-CoA carboxylase n=1 Tax=Sinorhizobium saheli TaxID=36856 RepID=A0A178YN30_SINSA|nr:acetyl-CoA carboxylase biotin carboxyl carrier protein [Sinorhizobium saheli]MQW88278.1 acetyl-CoA carboxylase biotin carboxyl carrier protein [Sinorhizobium saheli]OAP48972.1 acetyl-CoA carboxylase biotin carboxyl carrier protein subunit [Sinorhizobium saheli]
MADKKPGIDQALIRDLANILKDTDLTEIEVEQDDLRIRVSRNGTPVAMSMPAMPAYQAPAFAAAQPAPAAAPVAVEGGHNAKNAVTAPMVGTAYLAPAPGARPFIEVGATVKEGQTILIIEAMKTMNQIPAPRSGKVTEILVQDAAPVEYGEPLIVIE